MGADTLIVTSVLENAFTFFDIVLKSRIFPGVYSEIYPSIWKEDNSFGSGSKSLQRHSSHLPKSVSNLETRSLRSWTMGNFAIMQSNKDVVYKENHI